MGNARGGDGNVTACFFRGQVGHVIALLVLLLAVWSLLQYQPLNPGSLWGISTRTWFGIAIAVPIAHQSYVWLGWRAELCCGWYSRRFGDRGFRYFEIPFLVLLVARPVTVLLLGVADRNSLPLSMGWRIALAGSLSLPAMLTFHSVVCYFGIARAAGLDHFDRSIGEGALVRRGVFRFVPNAMYTLGFLILWAIAIAAGSWGALIAAAFQHAYIWMHYCFTERPDMLRIYGRTGRL